MAMLMQSTRVVSQRQRSTKESFINRRRRRTKEMQSNKSGLRSCCDIYLCDNLHVESGGSFYWCGLAAVSIIENMGVVAQPRPCFQ